MDSPYLPAVAALAGSAIGGLTSFASAWLTQRHQDRANRLSRDKARRQKVYRQFIEEASKLYADALVHDDLQISTLVSAYALISRMRVLSSPPVLQKADAVIRTIIETYFSPTRPLLSCEPCWTTTRLIRCVPSARNVGLNWTLSRDSAIPPSVHAHRGPAHPQRLALYQ